MAATTKHRIYGHDVKMTLTLSNGDVTLLLWKNITFNLLGKEYDARVASSKVAQRDIFFDSVEGECRGLVGQGENLAVLPLPGTKITDIDIGTIEEGADLIPSLDDFGDFVVANLNYAQGEEAGEYTLPFKSTGFSDDNSPSPSQPS